MGGVLVPLEFVVGYGGLLKNADSGKALVLLREGKGFLFSRR